MAACVGTLPRMVITSVPGPDWATTMTAFGTVGAVIAAVGIAIWSARSTNARIATERVEADRRLREQFSHSDEQLSRRQEHSDDQLRQQQENNERQLSRTPPSRRCRCG